MVVRCHGRRIRNTCSRVCASSRLEYAHEDLYSRDRRSVTRTSSFELYVILVTCMCVRVFDCACVSSRVPLVPRDSEHRATISLHLSRSLVILRAPCQLTAVSSRTSFLRRVWVKDVYIVPDGYPASLGFPIIYRVHAMCTQS